jgi:FKBP-type peptidyl-prolyl cis-trans isomerase SlyD
LVLVHLRIAHQVGDQLDLHLEPEEAFGDFDEELIF